jgi:hypothetical protein
MYIYPPTVSTPNESCTKKVEAAAPVPEVVGVVHLNVVEADLSSKSSQA